MPKLSNTSFSDGKRAAAKQNTYGSGPGAAEEVVEAVPPVLPKPKKQAIQTLPNAAYNKKLFGQKH